MKKSCVHADLSNVDWKLLKRQKESLVRAISGAQPAIGKGCREHLEGILQLIDHIQDGAAQQIGERTVFGQSPARNETRKPRKE